MFVKELKRTIGSFSRIIKVGHVKDFIGRPSLAENVALDRIERR